MHTPSPHAPSLPSYNITPPPPHPTPPHPTPPHHSPRVFALEVCRVHASQHQLPALLVLHSAVQPEAKDWLWDQLLINHVLKGSGDMAHTDFRETEALWGEGRKRIRRGSDWGRKETEKVNSWLHAETKQPLRHSTHSYARMNQIMPHSPYPTHIHTQKP
jgi:hypothetical protein